MARVGCSTTRSSGPMPRASLVASRSPAGGQASKALWMAAAVIPCASSWERDSSLTVTWTQAGSSGGGGQPAKRARCQGRSWWRITVRRPRSTPARAPAASGLSGSEQTFSTTTRSASSRATASATRSSGGGGSPPVTPAPMDNPGTQRSTGPAPATVTVRKPSWRSAQAHFPASMDTPSVPPRRYDTTAARGLASPETRWAPRRSRALRRVGDRTALPSGPPG